MFKKIIKEIKAKLNIRPLTQKSKEKSSKTETIHYQVKITHPYVLCGKDIKENNLTITNDISETTCDLCVRIYDSVLKLKY